MMCTKFTFSVRTRAWEGGILAKYDEWLTEEGLIKLEGYARDGMVDRELASAMGISRTTLNKWKDKFPQMAAVLKCGKEIADRKVENALFDKCTGKTVTLKKPLKVKRVEYDQKTGKKIAEHEEVIQAEQEEYIPADTKAIQFWLTNRKPDVWKNKVEIDNKEDGEETGIIQIETEGNEELIDGEYIEIKDEGQKE